MSSFAKGAVVQLVSGSPKMSVVSVSDYSSSGGPSDGVNCMWFDAKGIKHEDVFDAAVLKPYASAIGVVGLRRG